MPPAIIAAGISAVGAIGGAELSSHAQKSAAQQATNATTAASNQATQAQLQLGQQSLGQNANIYKSNFNLLSPFVSRGNVAGDSINALLGLPNAPQIAPPDISGAPQAGPAPQQPLGPSMQDIAAMQHDGIPGNYRNALAQMGANQGGGGIPGIVSPVGALLTGGRMF
jgi:hypothetical protein